MTRTRCGLFALSSLTLKLPLASVWLRPDSSMPCARLRRTTSSPAAGLFVVPFFTVPVRVCADAETTRSIDSNKVASSHFSQRKREVGHPVSCLNAFLDENFKLWLLFDRAVAR